MNGTIAALKTISQEIKTANVGQELSMLAHAHYLQTPVQFR